jgi:hypothetical protein
MVEPWKSSASWDPAKFVYHQSGAKADYQEISGISPWFFLDEME